MTVLFVSHTADLSGGSSQSLLGLLTCLKSEYNNLVVVPENDGNLGEALDSLSIPFFVAPCIRTFCFLPFLVYIILKYQVNLVYGNNFSGRSRVALWAAKLTGRPFVWHIRESLTKNSPRSNTIWLKHADAIVANSEDTARRISQFTNKQQVIVVPNGIEIDDSISYADAKQHACNGLGLSSDSIIIVNVGRICLQKNQLDSISAVSQVFEDYKSLTLLFLGKIQNREYADQLLGHATELELDDYMQLMGHVEDVRGLMRCADVLLHTSRKESQGRVILEAMAASLPVVAYDVGGVRESVVDGKTGFLVPLGDVHRLSTSLSRLVSSERLRKEMGSRGFQRVEKLFTVERMASRVKQVIDQTLYGSSTNT